MYFLTLCNGVNYDKIITVDIVGFVHNLKKNINLCGDLQIMNIHEYIIRGGLL